MPTPTHWSPNTLPGKKIITIIIKQKKTKELQTEGTVGTNLIKTRRKEERKEGEEKRVYVCVCV